MILVRPAPEEPPRVAVDARDVDAPRKIGAAPGKEREGLGRERFKWGIDKVLKFLLVGQEPGPLVVEGQLPEEAAGFFTEARKHAHTVFLKVGVLYHASGKVKSGK